MNTNDIAARYQRRTEKAERLARRAVQQIGQRMLQVSNQLMHEEIYAKPEDRAPSGRYLWRRTNQLAYREQLVFLDGGMTAQIVNVTPYAVPRHEANKPGRRKINPRRTAHWRDDMIERLTPEIRAIMGDIQFQILRG